MAKGKRDEKQRFEFVADIHDEEEELIDEVEIVECAVVPVRDTVVFPHMVSPLFVGREASVKAVEAAMQAEESIVVVTQRDEEIQEPAPRICTRLGPRSQSGGCCACRMGRRASWGKGSSASRFWSSRRPSRTCERG